MKSLKAALALLPLLTMLLSSCGKVKPDCKAAVTNYMAISESMKNSVPYYSNNAFDTVSFTNGTGDTLVYMLSRKDSDYYYCEEINNDPACPWDRNCFQRFRYFYTSIKGNLEFGIDHSKKTSDEMTDVVGCRLGNLVFFTTDELIGQKINTVYFDSIMFNGKTYHSVICLYHNWDSPTTGKAYVNKEFGFFRIEDIKNNVNWNLLTP